jgi:hypothetical protein
LCVLFGLFNYLVIYQFNLGTHKRSVKKIPQVFYGDTGNDGYRDNNSSIVARVTHNDYVDNNADCDANNSSINPDAEEIFYS